MNRHQFLYLSVKINGCVTVGGFPYDHPLSSQFILQKMNLFQHLLFTIKQGLFRQVLFIISLVDCSFKQQNEKPQTLLTINQSHGLG